MSKPSDEKKCPVTHLTTQFGAPVPDNQNSLTAGPRGPLLSQDVWLHEKLGNFVREVIPERRMHAKGSGAFGTFTVTNDITKYTRAKIFESVGKKTEMFARFTTVAGERGAADAERDIRGFALKFYTEEGNWDMVGNNTPVFFIRDPRKFPDLNKAVKRDPRTNLRSATNNWDWWTLLPEALHQVTIVMSDRGIPASYRNMHGFGSHTYSFWNTQGERYWVKFHFRTQQGIRNLTDAEAAELVGNDRESHQRDLYDAIERGDFPKWKMYIQVMPETDAEKVPYHPFDLTKVWPKGDYPLIEVGEFEQAEVARVADLTHLSQPFLLHDPRRLVVFDHRFVGSGKAGAIDGGKHLRQADDAQVLASVRERTRECQRKRSAARLMARCRNRRQEPDASAAEGFRIERKIRGFRVR